MKINVSGGRFERIAADLAGPIPKSGNGNRYILVVADYFSKYTEIYPLPNMEAETIADAVFRGWIKRYGCPYEIHTDQGSQFESQLYFLNFVKYCAFQKLEQQLFIRDLTGWWKDLMEAVKK